MMQKRFNDTGLCIPDRHYMVDTSVKLKQIIQLVERSEYFTINPPRQFGKTTSEAKVFAVLMRKFLPRNLSLLAKQLNQRDDCVALKISFEEIDTDSYQNQAIFIYLYFFGYASQRV